MSVVAQVDKEAGAQGPSFCFREFKRGFREFIGFRVHRV